MEAAKLKALLNQAESSYNASNKKYEFYEQRIPSDYICKHCLRFIGCNPKRWVINNSNLSCKSCWQEGNNKGRNAWNNLSEEERVDLVFDVINQHQNTFHKICRYDDEIYEAAILDRITNFVTNYNPEKGVLYSYLKATVKWYVMKATRIRARERERNPLFTDLNYELVDNEDGELVDYQRTPAIVEDETPIYELLESLHPFDKWLIEQHIINGWSQEELAAVSRKCKSTINKWVGDICKELAREFEE